MRTELKNINGARKRFVGTFVRFGTKKGYKGRTEMTLLFQEVYEVSRSMVSVCDHIWFTSGKQFEALDLKEGDKICFDARVKPYTKGYKGYREDFDLPPVSVDYKLSHPNNIVKHIEGSQGQLF